MTEAIKDAVTEEAKPVTEEAKTPAKTKAAPVKKHKVTIHSSESDKGDVEVGHNFRLIRIQRDVEVEIDEHYLNALKSSVIETFIEDDDGKRRAVTIPRFPFSSTPV